MQNLNRLFYCVTLTLMMLAQGNTQLGLSAQDSSPSPNAQERIVFLGSEFVEQQIKHNFLEAELTCLWSKKDVQFRNLGWAGDTPSAISRGYFNGKAEGFSRLKAELGRIKPTMIFVCYGANAEVDEFEQDFATLFEVLKTHTTNIVVVSHPAAESLGEKYADPTAANLIREKSSEVLKKFVAAQREASIRFIDLFQLSKPILAEDSNLTTDTIRFTEAGYQVLSGAVLYAGNWKNIKLKGKLAPKLSKPRLDQLRRLIATKNELYFHRYRPQNETYLRGFRKHEQGQNAVEIAQFDALIEQAESRIRAFVREQPIPQPIAVPDDIQLSFEAKTPDEQQAMFKLADGLEISLFASEPMVANPIHMNFDSQGRLWVATSPIYPQIKPGAKPSDEIVVLEDTDGDGRADKKTVFANDLLIPTAVLPDERGGAYVANSTEMVHLQDTDGDGVADKRRVVLSGFGTEDTHHIVHTFRWGPDASIYFNQSIYIHTHMETPHGVKRLMGSGIWRFEPNKVQANVLMRGLVNPWGHVFDDWGQSFATDGAGGNGINYAFPGSAYPTAVGFSKVMQGMNPGQPKLCGLEIISGDHFPKEWRGTLVTNDFRGNRINRFQLSRQDSGYASKQLPDLLSSSYRAFRPVDVKMAPDGSLFVADWFNPIINHGEVDFRDSRRDYKHGRIWRVRAAGRPNLAQLDFLGASNAELVKLLAANAQGVRVKARVELKYRFEDASVETKTELINLVQPLLASENSMIQLEGIWTLEAFKAATPENFSRLVRSGDDRVRAAVLRCLANQLNPTAGHLELVKQLATDEHPQVQLEFINAWRSLLNPSDVDLLKSAIEKRGDMNIEFALSNALKDTSASWIGDLTNHNFAKNLNSLMYVLQTVNAPETVEPMLNLLTGDPAGPHVGELAGLIGKRGNNEQLKSLFEFATKNETVREKILTSLVSAGPRGGVKPNIDPAALQALFDSLSAIRLAGLWKVDALKPKIIELATSQSTNNVGQKVAAVQSLAGYQDIGTLRSIGNSKQDLIVRRFAISELAAARIKMAAAMAPKFFKDAAAAGKTEEAEKLVSVLLSRRNGGQVLVDALSKSPLPSELVEPLRERAKQFRREGNVFRTAIVGATATKMKKKLSPAEIDELIAEVTKSGNPQRGESIYRRDELNCIRCHAIGGAGGAVGPDMISLGASSPVDYIIQSLLEPNAKIKEGYHTTSVLTLDGLQVSGKLMSQADGQLVMLDANAKEVVIKEEDIDEQSISTTSLMPADLTDKLGMAEFVDLVAFLSSLGKEGDFKISTEKFVRRWELQDKTIRYSRVDGLLPVSDISTDFVSFEMNVTTPGSIGVHVENANGLRVTLDDMKDNLRAEKIVKDLSVGKHRFTFKVNKANREGLRVKLFDVEGSQARAVLVNQ